MIVISIYVVLNSENNDLFYLDKIEYQFNQKIVSPLKQFGNFLKQKFFPQSDNLEQKGEELLDQTKDKLNKTIDQKQEQVEEKAKEYIKTETKSWFAAKLDKTKQRLSPLKTKIQQGSDWLRNKLTGFNFSNQ